MAEMPLGKVGLTFDDITFVAEVQDADVAEPPRHPEWLVAAHGPTAENGMVVRTAGSWGTGSHRFSTGEGGGRTLVRVVISDRVETYPPAS